MADILQRKVAKYGDFSGIYLNVYILLCIFIFLSI